jgi:hypothetical protein
MCQYAGPTPVGHSCARASKRRLQRLTDLLGPLVRGRSELDHPLHRHHGHLSLKDSRLFDASRTPKVTHAGIRDGAPAHPPTAASTATLGRADYMLALSKARPMLARY